MTSKCNSLSIEILSKKYYGPADKSPEDVFMRVARVVAIPDVLFYLKSAQKPFFYNFIEIFSEDVRELVRLV